MEGISVISPMDFLLLLYQPNNSNNINNNFRRRKKTPTAPTFANAGVVLFTSFLPKRHGVKAHTSRTSVAAFTTKCSQRQESHRHRIRKPWIPKRYSNMVDGFFNNRRTVTTNCPPTRIFSFELRTDPLHSVLHRLYIGNPTLRLAAYHDTGFFSPAILCPSPSPYRELFQCPFGRAVFVRQWLSLQAVPASDGG
jgi:hypothetical protein